MLGPRTSHLLFTKKILGNKIINKRSWLAGTLLENSWKILERFLEASSDPKYIQYADVHIRLLGVCITTYIHTCTLSSHGKKKEKEHASNVCTS